MKPRFEKDRAANRPATENKPPLPAPHANGIAEEVAQIRVALLRAREEIGLEVERRHKAEKEFVRMVAADRERTRKKLHDGLGQVLTSISFLAMSLRMKLREQGISHSAELEEIVSLLNQAIAESRSLAAACDHPPEPRSSSPA